MNGDAHLTTEQREAYERDGFVIVPGVYTSEQVDACRRFFDNLAERGEPVEGHWAPDHEKHAATGEPLARYPRVMHPHRFDELSRAMLLEPRVGGVLRDLFDDEPVACQSMFYYKPPRSPGQSLHQDNFYLAVQPGTCVAAWTAIDPATPDNGGLYVVPGSHRMDVICPSPDDLKPGTNLVDPPKGMKAVPAVMQPGDTLFFNGSVIHGSGRNRSETQWRRAFICHYMPRQSTMVNKAYSPVLDFGGRVVDYPGATAGGPCGEALGAYANTYGTDAVVH